MLTIRILGLTALALLSVVPLAKPTSPTLTTQFFSQQLTYAHNEFNYNLTCGTGLVLGTLTFALWNFTENLFGRDTGSTWLAFKAINQIGPIAYLLKTADVSQTTTGTFPFYDSFGCGGHPGSDQAFAAIWNKTLAVINGQYLSWRVPASGSYTLLAVIGSSLSFPLTINETWTVTTIR